MMSCVFSFFDKNRQRQQELNVQLEQNIGDYAYWDVFLFQFHGYFVWFHVLNVRMIIIIIARNVAMSSPKIVN